MAFCKNCGNKLEDGVKFCGNCGTNVDCPTPAPIPAPTTAPVTRSMKPFKILGLIFTTAGGVNLIYALSKMNDLRYNLVFRGEEYYKTFVNIYLIWAIAVLITGIIFLIVGNSKSAKNTNCENKLNNETEFCGDCGTNVDSQTSAPTTAPVTNSRSHLRY